MARGRLTEERGGGEWEGTEIKPNTIQVIKT